MKSIVFFFFLAIVVVVSGCGKFSVGSGQERYEMFVKFWNPNGNNPQLSYDINSSAKEIKIFTPSISGVAVPPNFTNVIIDNVRIIDNNNVNYKIDEIIAYEFRNDIDDWKKDVEFTMSFVPVVDLKVILVLDASASLGGDFVKIKQFAKDFITKILQESPSAQIGIVDFSDVINSTPLTNNQATLHTYVDNIQQGQFITLYEAMNTGIDILQNTAAGGKVLVTFTDGTDNNSKPQFTSGFIRDKLVNDPNAIKINSFTVGLDGNGGVDRAVLENLAANGGVAEFPSSISALEHVFQKFSKSVSNVYNFKYVRNQQVIPFSNQASLKFVVCASPK
jgi:Ca-activated chloride channel homolog